MLRMSVPLLSLVAKAGFSHRLWMFKVIYSTFTESYDLLGVPADRANDRGWYESRVGTFLISNF